MGRKVVILHGWSDSSKSFQPLASRLQTALGAEVSEICLGDYLTMDDRVTFDDLDAALRKAWFLKGLPSQPGSVDMVVHSTGGLVFRRWWHSFGVRAASQFPVARCVMLAPANFGSPVAHKGASFIGRVLKGWGTSFMVGEQLLKGLELGSPYTWQMGLMEQMQAYVPGRPMITVLVGNQGYGDIRAAANGYGDDGTVRISTANLNFAFADVDMTGDKAKLGMFEYSDLCAFGVVSGENHGSIKIPLNEKGFKYLCTGLTVTPQAFPAWRDELKAKTAEVRRENLVYQNTVVRVRDQDGNPVPDYFLEFYRVKENWFERRMHGDAIVTTHAYSDDPSYRCFLINCDVVNGGIGPMSMGGTTGYKMSLSALPDIAKTKTVGYDTFKDGNGIEVDLTSDDLKRLFVPNRTLLVNITVKRMRSDKVFKIS